MKELGEDGFDGFLLAFGACANFSRKVFGVEWKVAVFGISAVEKEAIDAVFKEAQVSRVACVVADVEVVGVDVHA